MSLKKRLDKLEPVIEERRIKRLAAVHYQMQVGEGLLRAYNGLPAAEYARAEAVLLGHLYEVLQDAFGDGWRGRLWLSPLSEA
jgi:hypothetical protein